jgi:hypothetical protein
MKRGQHPIHLLKVKITTFLELGMLPSLGQTTKIMKLPAMFSQSFRLILHTKTIFIYTITQLHVQISKLAEWVTCFGEGGAIFRSKCLFP